MRMKEWGSWEFRVDDCVSSEESLNLWPWAYVVLLGLIMSVMGQDLRQPGHDIQILRLYVSQAAFHAD